MSEQQQEHVFVPVELVFAGQRTNSKGKRVYSWYRVADCTSWGTLDNAVVPASVGGIYLFHESEDGSRFKSAGEFAPKYLRRYDDIDQVREWAVRDEKAKQELSVKSLNTKAAKISPIDELLEPIARVASGFSSSEKRAFLAKLAEVVFRA